jgi:hypothetical protein
MESNGSSHDRTRRSELQRMLGEHGTVLPYQSRGTAERPAKGWHVELAETHETIFVGDHMVLAVQQIALLVRDA